MKPDYQNWIPDRFLYATYAAAGVSLFGLFASLDLFPSGFERTFCLAFFGLAFVVLAAACLVMRRLHRAFDFEGDQQVSRRIIEAVASRVKIPEGGRALEPGCGSGPLSISVALKNPKATVLGLDLWPRGFSSFSQTLCEANAKAEGAGNVSFMQGDAMKLPFPDESFDAVFSNYLYSCCQTRAKQEAVRESLRILKKGGTFVLHDTFLRKSKFGDMKAFAEALKREGFKRVELIDSTDGLVLGKSEAWRLNLSGSAFLVGRK